MQNREPIQTDRSERVRRTLLSLDYEVVEVLEIPGCDCCGHYFVTLGDGVRRAAFGMFGSVEIEGFEPIRLTASEFELSQRTCSHQEPCGCRRCVEASSEWTGLHLRMVLCEICGSKRCPHATDHRNECTGSNEPNQPGSDY